MATTTTTTKTGGKGTRDTWTIACVDAGLDCSFKLTDHNQKELTTMSLTHLKNVHNITTKTEKDLLGLAKASKF